MTWDMSYANVQPAGDGAFTATPNPIAAVRGEKTSYDLSWTGLTAGARYLGLVQYGDSAVRTVVTVTTPDAAKQAPPTDAPPTDAPETDAPETDAPESDAPESDAPKTEAPETPAPESPAPETPKPE